MTTKNSNPHIKHLQFFVENLSMPWKELRDALKSELKLAKETETVRYMCYAGPYDILVHPNGTFQLIPGFQFKSYVLDGDHYRDVNQCNNKEHM